MTRQSLACDFLNATLTEDTTSLSPSPINNSSLVKTLKTITPETGRNKADNRQGGFFQITIIQFSVFLTVLAVWVGVVTVAAAAVAIALGIAVPLGVTRETVVNEINLTVQSNCPFLPVNFVERPEVSTPSDGCSNSTVLFDDQQCYPLLTSCRDQNFWTTVSPVTLRVCKKADVFITNKKLNV